MLSVATCRRSMRPPSGRWHRRMTSGAVSRGSAGDRQRERERRARPLLRLDPDPPAVLLDDVARDGQPEPGPAARLAAEARPVDLVEPLEDPGLGGPRDADAMVLDATSRPRRPSSRTGPTTSPPSGLNLTALWTRLTTTWPSRAASPRTGGRPGAISTREGDALAIGEQPQPLGRLGRELAHVEAVDELRACRRSRSATGRAAR